MGNQAKDRAYRLFTIEAMVDQFEAIYRELAAK